jgi:hypothetical protein
MPDERIIMRGLLPALWSFLQHPAANFEAHLTAIEERLRLLEVRIVGDVKTRIDTRVAAVEQTVAGVEQRLEADLEHAIRGRVAAIQARLETIKKRVVEDLKRELHRVLLVLALAMGCGVLALIGTIFALMAIWTDLKGFIGSVGASLVLAAVFLVTSLLVFGILRWVLHRSASVNP